MPTLIEIPEVERLEQTKVADARSRDAQTAGTLEVSSTPVAMRSMFSDSLLESSIL